MKAKILAVACAAFSAAGWVHGAVADAQPGASREHPASAEQARAAGIAMIARSFGITPEAAASRMNVEEHAPALVERIRARYADRLAGITIEHVPTHRLIVRLTGFAPVRSEFYRFDDGHAGTDLLVVDYRVGAEHTLADLQARFDAGFARLKRSLPALQSGYVDERTGQLVLEVVADPRAKRDMAASAAQQQLADNVFGVATRVVPMGPLSNQSIQGSGNLDFIQSGVATQCTGAFTVKSVSTPVTYGLLTAGHCQSTSGTFNYTPAGATSPITVLTYVASKYDAASDISWASVSTNPADALSSFYNGTIYVKPSSRISKAGTMVGASMCHYGRSSSSVASVCGVVQSVAYNPGSICAPGGTGACSATYVAVDVPVATPCQAIDSGGPWFANSIHPSGIHKAGDVTTGRCVYTSTDDIFGGTLNLQLL